MCVAPVLLIAEPARIANVAAAPIATVGCEVVCKGICCVFVDGEGEGVGAVSLSFLHPETNAIERMVITVNILVFIILSLLLFPLLAVSCEISRYKGVSYHSLFYYITLLIIYIIHTI
jgi:hypothetical protein